MEVKVFEKSLKVSKKLYIELHNDIQKSKNLKDIRKLIDDFNYVNDVDKNTYFQGISIYEDFNYIITNSITNRKYIGETSNLISRMYSYQMLDVHNKELKSDMIEFGMLNFTIEIFKPLNDKKENEKILISKYQDNCYNIIYTDKKISIKKRRGYEIGDIFYFKSKDEIRKYCRKTLDKYRPNTEIPLTDLDGKFAIAMIKLHPNYDGFLDKSTNVKLFIIRDDKSDAMGTGKYNIFNFKYTDSRNTKQDWGFSTNKIIQNL